MAQNGRDDRNRERELDYVAAKLAVISDGLASSAAELSKIVDIMRAGMREPDPPPPEE